MPWRFADLLGEPIKLATDRRVAGLGGDQDELDGRILLHISGRLAELECLIEDFDSWATRPEDVETLTRLEQVRDDLRTALGLAHDKATGSYRREWSFATRTAR